MKTIIVNHPTAKKVMSLEELQEVTFRIAEHLQEYWEKMDRVANGKIGNYGNLAFQADRLTTDLYKTAWRIRHLREDYGELPF